MLPNGKAWEAWEIEFLKENYPLVPVEELSQKLDRTIASIRVKASKSGIRTKKRNRYASWPEEDEAFLREHYFSWDAIALSKKLKRSIPAIKNKALKMGLRSGKKWSEDERLYLLSLVGEYPWSSVPSVYNSWAKKRGFLPRTAEALVRQLYVEKTSRRLDCSSTFISVQDFTLLLGCDRATIYRYLKVYKEQLKKRGAKDTRDHSAVSRSDLRKFLLENQDIVEKHQKTLDIRWLLDIVTT